MIEFVKFRRLKFILKWKHYKMETFPTTNHTKSTLTTYDQIIYVHSLKAAAELVQNTKAQSDISNLT